MRGEIKKRGELHALVKAITRSLTHGRYFMLALGVRQTLTNIQSNLRVTETNIKQDLREVLGIVC